MAIADQLNRLNVLRQTLADTLTTKGVTAASTEGLETLVPKVAEITVSVCVIKITFDSAFVGQSYTVTDGNGDTKTGIVPESCVDSVSVANCNTTYTISAAVGGVTYSNTVTTGAYYGEYTATLLTAKIYGVQWDGTSTTAWTRTDDAALFTDPVPYVSGASSYGSPFDNLQPWAGMERVTDSAAGELVKIPKFWYKWTQSGNTLKLQISNGAQDGFFVSPAHADRGDGKGERDVVYVGRYQSCSTYKSTTGQAPKVSITRSAARSGITALGSGIYQFDIAMWVTIQMLYLVEFADWDSQVKIGYGCGSSSAVQNVGASDSMPYHTGTMQNSRTTFGLGVQYRYIEGLWENVYYWLDGCYYNSNGLNIVKNTANFSDTANGTAVGTPTDGYPSAMSVATVSGLEWVIYPTAANGSNTTYVSDIWAFDANSPCLRVGGYYSQGMHRGLFFVGCNTAADAKANIGCRLQELP